MLCFPTQVKVGTLCVKDHQVLRLEHKLGPMEILKNLKRNIYVLKKIDKKIYSWPFNFANLGLSRISRNKWHTNINGVTVIIYIY